MTDEEAIRELQLDYARHFDARDAQAFADLYTDDAVLVQIGGKEIRTREKFVKSVVNMPPPNGGYHKVLETDTKIYDDEASASVRFQARTTNGQDVTGHYEDSYRRTPEGWRITRRAVFLD
jgi:uncharacterized protein (TIGR02246 family)